MPVVLVPEYFPEPAELEKWIHRYIDHVENHAVTQRLCPGLLQVDHAEVMPNPLCYPQPYEQAYVVQVYSKQDFFLYSFIVKWNGNTLGWSAVEDERVIETRIALMQLYMSSMVQETRGRGLIEQMNRVMGV